MGMPGAGMLMTLPEFAVNIMLRKGSRRVLWLIGGDGTKVSGADCRTGAVKPGDVGCLKASDDEPLPLGKKQARGTGRSKVNITCPPITVYI